MARLPRVIQKLFASTATANQIAKYGSLAAGSPVRYSGPTADPTAIQSLGNFLQGWFGAAVGSNSPAEEDMNALFYLCFYQLCYTMQSGVPEWETGTTYYTGSIVQDGTGVLYVSITNGNVGHALSDTTNWQIMLAPGIATAVVFIPGISGPYVMAASDNGKIFQVSGAGQFTLPSPVPGFRFTVFMQISSSTGLQFGVGAVNAITIAQHSTERIQGKAASLILRAPYGRWTFICGTDSNWYIDA